MGEHKANYLTMSQNFALEAALHPLHEAGFHVFMVGSCLERADFRDVDLRCWLPDEADHGLIANRVRRRFLDAAVSEWLRARTGLPIDFQFQSKAEFNEHKGKPRNGAGILLFCEHEADKRDQEQSQAQGE